MALASASNGVATELTGVTYITPAGTQCPYQALLVMDEQARNAIGVYTIVEPDPTPRYKQVASSSLVFENGLVTRVNVLDYVSLAGHKLLKSIDVDAVWAEKTFAGFSYDFGGEIGARTLQTREEDQARWLALKDACNDAIMAGIGAQSSPIQLRPADNVNITLTFNQIADAMRALRAQQATILAYSWGLKDAITAAANHAALDAIIITVGWPT